MNQQQHQRFSWQMPLQEETPTYQVPLQETPAYQVPQQPQISTNVPQHNRIFSYTQTPIEHRAPSNSSSPSDIYTPIDPRPQSHYPTIHSPTHATLSHPHDENPPVSPLSPHDPTRTLPFSPFSPISPVQGAQDVPTQQASTWQNNHARQMSNLAPINTSLVHHAMPPVPPINTSLAQHAMPPVPPTPTSQASSPLPHKTPITPLSAKSERDAQFQTTEPNQPTEPTEPYSPHGFSNQTTNHHAIFSPDSPHGPNGLDFTLHQPGQIGHPNMDLSTKGAAHEWKHALCSCSGDVSTCLTGLFCPCILYGRTSYRLSQKSRKQDPTDMLSQKATNTHCMLMGVACGLWWLFPMLQRTRIRHSYKLEGSLGGDCIKGVCCCCCVAVQNEREVKEREESARRWAGPAIGGLEVYTRTLGMAYKPQV